VRKTKNSIETDIQDLQWLVDSRSKIQVFLLRIYERIKADSRGLQSIELQLLLGAGFSLWRSVFLVERDRQLKGINTTAIKFLDLLIKDNAIGYPQDRETRKWTAGYYVNNAYFRLHLAYCRLKFTTQLSKTVDTFLAEQETTATATDVMTPWDNALEAALEILKKLSNGAPSDGRASDRGRKRSKKP